MNIKVLPHPGKLLQVMVDGRRVALVGPKIGSPINWLRYQPADVCILVAAAIQKAQKIPKNQRTKAPKAYRLVEVTDDANGPDLEAGEDRTPATGGDGQAAVTDATVEDAGEDAGDTAAGVDVARPKKPPSRNK